jgi:hypothetical protein
VSGKGPIEDNEWPERLVGRVVDRGERVRIHGYDVEGELARYYSFTEVVFLALTGELPTSVQTRAFEIASIYLSPVSIGEAPAHAAALARLIDSAPAATIGVTAIVLGEDAESSLRSLAALLEWLRAPAETLPAGFGAESDGERQRVHELRALLGSIGFETPILRAGLDPSIKAALFGVLFALGLDDVRRMHAAIVWARMPCAIAEALAWPGLFRGYPMDLPDFRHKGADR